MLLKITIFKILKLFSFSLGFGYISIHQNLSFAKSFAICHSLALHHCQYLNPKHDPIENELEVHTYAQVQSLDTHTFIHPSSVNSYINITQVFVLLENLDNFFIAIPTEHVTL